MALIIHKSICQEVHAHQGMDEQGRRKRRVIPSMFREINMLVSHGDGCHGNETAIQNVICGRRVSD